MARLSLVSYNRSNLQAASDASILCGRMIILFDCAFLSVPFFLTYDIFMKLLRCLLYLEILKCCPHLRYHPCCFNLCPCQQAWDARIPVYLTVCCKCLAFRSKSSVRDILLFSVKLFGLFSTTYSGVPIAYLPVP